METSRILGWGKRQRRSDLESGKSIRVRRYEERLSETGTWQLRRKHRKDLRGRMLSLREGKIRDSPQPQFLSPCATQHPPPIHLPQSPASSPGCCCPFSGNVCKHICTMPQGTVSQAQGRDKEPRAGARYGPQPKRNQTNINQPHLLSHTIIKED